MQGAGRVGREMGAWMKNLGCVSSRDVRGDDCLLLRRGVMRVLPSINVFKSGKHVAA